MIAHDPNNYTSWLSNYQSMLRNKFKTLERIYYSPIDDLTQQLGDLESKWAFENFDLNRLAFLDEWEHGLVDSSYVLNILHTWDFYDVATLSMTRKLNNFACLNPEVNELVKNTVSDIKANAVPAYVGYLETLYTFFKKAAECDAKQKDITWLAVSVDAKGEMRTSASDYTLNQVVRQIDYFVVPHFESTFFLGPNIICLNEGVEDDGANRAHWIFAPSGYIAMLKLKYNISDALDPKDDSAYIKKLIGDYVNAPQ